jgi:acetyl-CoA carboxylase biotin carboxyl carrier protein
MKIDKNLIKELSEYLNEFNLTEIEFTEKDTKIKVSKNNISINNQTIPVTQKPSNITESAPKAKKYNVWNTYYFTNNWNSLSCTRTWG